MFVRVVQISLLSEFMVQCLSRHNGHQFTRVMKQGLSLIFSQAQELSCALPAVNETHWAVNLGTWTWIEKMWTWGEMLWVEVTTLSI